MWVLMWGRFVRIHFSQVKRKHTEPPPTRSLFSAYRAVNVVYVDLISYNYTAVL